jgi:hypothetical protein
MHPSQRPATVWINWLDATAWGVIVFGLALVIAPGLALQAFSLLVYSNPGHIASFGVEAASYASLAHAVLGGVMIGWGVVLYMVVRNLFAYGYRIGWQIVAFSVAAWFVPDTGYSLWSGFWQDAVLNTVFLILFAIPLWATKEMLQKNEK